MARQLRSLSPWRALSVVLALAFAYFLYDTFPRPYVVGSSSLHIELLPLGQWRVGTYYAESLAHPQSGYIYGVLLVRRDHDLIQ